jgi:hypothetical protein
VGAVVQLIGTGLLWMGLSWGSSFSIWHIAPGMVVSGLGTGIVVAALFDAILSSIANDEVGSGAGVLSAVQSIGSSAGVAVFGTVFFASATVGQFTQGFRDCLVVEVVVVVAFLLATTQFAGGTTRSVDTPPQIPATDG